MKCLCRVRSHEHRWRFGQGSHMIQKRHVPAKADIWWDSSNELYCLIASHDENQNYPWRVSSLLTDAFLIRAWDGLCGNMLAIGIWDCFCRTLWHCNTLLTLRSPICCHLLALLDHRKFSTPWGCWLHTQDLWKLTPFLSFLLRNNSISYLVNISDTPHTVLGG